MKKLVLALALFVAGTIVRAQTGSPVFFFDSVLAKGKVNHSGSPVTPAAGQMVWVLNSSGVFTKTNIGSVGDCWKVTGSSTLGWGSCGGGGGGGSSPLTTKGDLWGFDTADARVPVGSNGTALFADSGQMLGVHWRGIADSDVTWGSQTHNTFWASGCAASGAPSFRTICARDITPALGFTATPGDLITSDGGSFSVLAAGADGKILEADSGQTNGLGYSTRNFDAGGLKLTNLGAPSASSSDAATTSYVDTADALKADKSLSVTATQGVSRTSGTDLSAAAQFTLAFNGLTSYSTPIPTDILAVLDVTAATHKKITVGTLSKPLGSLFSANQLLYSTGSDLGGIATGSSGQVLTWGTPPTWQTPGAGSGCAGSLTTGSVIFVASAACSEDNSHFFYDSTNHRLGVGGGTVSSPGFPLEVIDAGSTALAHFKNTADNASLLIETTGGSTKDAGIAVKSSHQWLWWQPRSSFSYGSGLFALCDQTLDSGCETVTATGANRLAFDTNGSAFFQGGSVNFGVAAGSSPVTTNGHVGVGRIATSDGYLAVKDSACLYGTSSGNICLGLAGSGGDGTRYNLPVSAPSGSNVLLQCGVPSGATSTCTWVAGPSGSIAGTLTSPKIPYASSSSAVADSDLVWTAGSHLLTVGSGGITFAGSTSGGPTFKSAATGGSATWTLPVTDGTTNQCLKTDGSGTLSFGGCGGASGGNIVNSTALGSEPGSPSAGDVNLPTNGVAIERYNGSSWANNWGPVYALKNPPAASSGTTTTLSAAISSSGATTLSATSNTGFPSTDYFILIDTEEIRVTNVSGATWTIVRGYGGTTAATHSNGATITLLNWAFVNQGSSTATQTTNQAVVFSTNGSSNTLRGYERPINSFTSFRIAFTIGGFNQQLGIYFRESSTDKTMFSYFVAGASAGTLYGAGSGTTFSGCCGTSQVPNVNTLAPNVYFMRFDISGSNVVTYVSVDGQNWIQTKSVAKTAVFTSAPNAWGIAVFPQSSTTWPAVMNLVSVTEQ